MSPLRHFTDLEVWRKAHRLFLDVLSDVNSYPETRGAEIVARQIISSSSSISSNISEGFNRSPKRFSNAIDIAYGEANETENWLYKIRDAGYLEEETVRDRLKTIIEIEKMLTGLKKKIDSPKKTVRENPPEYKIWPANEEDSR